MCMDVCVPLSMRCVYVCVHLSMQCVHEPERLLNGAVVIQLTPSLPFPLLETVDTGAGAAQL